MVDNLELNLEKRVLSSEKKKMILEESFFNADFDDFERILKLKYRKNVFEEEMERVYEFLESGKLNVDGGKVCDKEYQVVIYGDLKVRIY